MTRSRISTDEEWIEAIKSSMTNNSKPYTTVTWMHIETGKPIKTVRNELDKRVGQGLLVKIKVNGKSIWYKLSNNETV